MRYNWNYHATNGLLVEEIDEMILEKLPDKSYAIIKDANCKQPNLDGVAEA